MHNKISGFTENTEQNVENGKRELEEQDKDKEIARLKAELSQIHQYINEFVYTAAHAMKSPVANLNLVSILLEKTNDVEEFKSYLQTIKSSIKKLDQTIHGMVQGFQVKTVDDTPELVSLQSILDSILLKYQGKLNCLSTKISCNFEACPQVFFNRNILAEIVNILTLNSFTYKSEDRNLQVSITSERYCEYVLIQISDNGIGIDLERHGKDLYQPFKKFSPNSQGKGMGLYLVKILVEKNNGKIEIESKPYCGTTVKVFLKEQQKMV